MSIITISRGSFSKGKEVAERVAEKLNYQCVSRDVLIEASEHFNIPEIKLVRAIHDAPSILDSFTHGKERYVAYIREALLEYVKKDNVVYHGLAGQFFLKGIPHVLKIRITADLEDRIKNEAEKEGISYDAARKILVRDDEERRKWALTLYGLDPWDSRIYDMTIHIGCISINEAVHLILEAVKLPCFQKTDVSQKILEDYLLEARVKSAIPTEKVTAKNGVVIITAEASFIQEKVIEADIKRRISHIEGIKEIRVNVLPTFDTD
jgi:cytidylate kinase